MFSSSFPLSACSLSLAWQASFSCSSFDWRCAISCSKRDIRNLRFSSRALLLCSRTRCCSFFSIARLTRDTDTCVCLMARSVVIILLRVFTVQEFLTMEGSEYKTSKVLWPGWSVFGPLTTQSVGP
uniref:Putative secreted protein n=1 Tax=Ixodes ricinus TaxID=34613 RepID=A0A6B0UPK5_IXORI